MDSGVWAGLGFAAVAVAVTVYPLTSPRLRVLLASAFWVIAVEFFILALTTRPNLRAAGTLGVAAICGGAVLRFRQRVPVETGRDIKISEGRDIKISEGKRHGASYTRSVVAETRTDILAAAVFDDDRRLLDQYMNEWTGHAEGVVFSELGPDAGRDAP